MVLFITFTTIFHASLYVFDEYILNKRRNPTQGEINSGLLDGVLYLAIVAITIFTEYSQSLSNVYITLSFLSCLSIVKNEYFYPENMPAIERLVHALLYVFHSVILYAFYLSWQENFFVNNMTYWMLQLGYLALGFKAVSYKVIYWNFIHNK